MKREHWNRLYGIQVGDLRLLKDSWVETTNTPTLYLVMQIDDHGSFNAFTGVTVHLTDGYMTTWDA